MKICFFVSFVLDEMDSFICMRVFIILLFIICFVVLVFFIVIKNLSFFSKNSFFVCVVLFLFCVEFLDKVWVIVIVLWVLKNLICLVVWRISMLVKIFKVLWVCGDVDDWVMMVGNVVELFDSNVEWNMRVEMWWFESRVFDLMGFCLRYLIVVRVSR